MVKDLHQALDNLEMTYSQVIEISNSMTKDLLDPINKIIDSVGDNINSLSLDQLKDLMWKLQYKAYSLSEYKEKSALKAELAEAIQKEKVAMEFNGADGAVAIKNNVALLAASEEVVVQILYEGVSSQLKTKTDQLHRLVDCLKSILVARMQEAKLSINNIE